MRDAMRRIWSRLRRSPGLLLAIYTAVLILVLTRGLLSTDLDETGDSIYHLAAEAQVALAFKEGRSPFGPLDLNFGTPILKFYQPLLYLVNGAVSAASHLDVLVVHNLSIVLLFVLTPFVARFAYRAIGLPDLAAGIAALLGPLSIAGFGISFESLFSTAVINQLAGAVFLPLFVGVFARLLREGIFPLRAAAFFALAFLSHVMMAVYAVFTGALMFLVEPRDLRRIWKPLVVFCCLSALLVAFWLVPFVTLHGRHRPVPDSVSLPHEAYLQTAYTPGEATRMLVSGRLLDDAREDTLGARTGDDALSDKMNMSRGVAPRPPVLTVLTLLGLALCLLRIRVFAYRLLVAGFTFSFLLLIGPDDISWMRFLPFAGKIQFFRCTYLLEFFAFGVAGAGLEMIVSFVTKRLGRLPLGPRIAAAGAGIAVCLAALAGHAVLTSLLAKAQLMPASTEWFDAAAKVAEPMREGAPTRALVKHRSRTKDKRIGAYLGYRELSYVCGHWRIVGPVVANDLCALLAEPGRNMFVSHLAGVEYFMVDRERARSLKDLESEPGRETMRQIKRGRGHYMYRDTSAAFYSRADPAVLTIANDAQWLHLMRAWLGALRREGGVRPPMPILLPRGVAIDAELLAPFEAVWILDPEQVGAADARSLDRFAKGSGKVITVAGIPGLGSAETLSEGESVLTSVASREAARALRVKTLSRESNVGPFVLRVRAERPMVMILPEFAIDGWTAKVNGAPRPVMRAGPEMLGVAVPAGKSRVVLAWATPRLEAAMLGVSGIAWFGLFAAAVVGVSLRWRRRR